MTLPCCSSKELWLAHIHPSFRSEIFFTGKLSPKEQTVLLKEQRDWRCAIRIFRWIKSQKDYVPNVIHYNVVLRILGRAQQWDELRLCWIEMARDRVFPTNNTYGMLIDVYGKAGLLHESLLWVKHMKIRGIFPDEVTMNTVLQVLKDAGEFDRAYRFYKDWCMGRVQLENLEFESVDLDSVMAPMSLKHFLSTELFKAGERIPPSKILSSDEQGSNRKPRMVATYNTLIDLYGKAGRLEDASDAFAEMLRLGVEPDTVTFNTMIHICGSHGHLSESVSLLNKMEEKGFKPDTKTYNIFLSLYNDAGDIEAVFKSYRKIKESGLYPDTITYRTMVQILCKRKMVEEVDNVLEEIERAHIDVDQQLLPLVMDLYINEGLLEKAKLFFDKHCTREGISSKNYAAIMDVYAERGLWSEAEAIFFQKRDSSQRKDLVEYNVMIKAYGKARLYDKALSVFGSMRSSGTWPDECTYNSLIQMLAGGELPDNAKDLLGKMVEAGMRPRCETFSVIIASFARSGQISDAVEILQEMLRVGVEPNHVIYGALINAFAETGKVDEAFRYFRMMEESGIPANQIVLTSLIKAYNKVGFWKEAQKIYGKMKDLEGGPDIIASNSMINLYSDLGMIQEAESIFNALKQKGLADGISFATMMHLYKSMGMLDEAINIAEEMQESGLLIDSTSFNSVLTSYATNGQLRECGELLHQMLSRKLLPDWTSFKIMFIVLKKGGIPTEAVTQLQTAYEDGNPFARQAIITLVFSVVGLHTEALESCEAFAKAKVAFDSYAYNVAIYTYGASGDVDKALTMYMRMQDEGVAPDIVTYINLVGCYGKAGLVEGVKRVYGQMNYGEIELNESLFHAIIDAYKDAGRHDLAELVDQEMRFSFPEEEATESVNFDVEDS
ncbi:pentatricopeptide repeat-containing protein At1g73710 isoform X2 [Aristolochia californica]|uniref:pentatricopeptide repeat-containing protein At1g73710 isoform X2 n=1 Tax=Aristolochia californica TaxID=171875 RepID=UPI0035D67253